MGKRPPIDSGGENPTQWGDGKAAPRPGVPPGGGAPKGPMHWAGDSKTAVGGGLERFIPEGTELPPDLLAEQQAVLLKPGDVVAERFEVIDQLGFGGMGAVYHVKDLKLGGEKALKLMLPSLLGSETAQRRFLSEVSISQQLRHENIVTVYDLARDTQRKIHFFTMEYVPGKTLHRLLHDRGGKLPLDAALDITRQICAALEYAHQHTSTAI